MTWSLREFESKLRGKVDERLILVSGEALWRQTNHVVDIWSGQVLSTGAVGLAPACAAGVVSSGVRRDLCAKYVADCPARSLGAEGSLAISEQKRQVNVGLASPAYSQKTHLTHIDPKPTIVSAKVQFPHKYWLARGFLSYGLDTLRDGVRRW